MRGIEHIPWLYDALMSVMDVTGFSRWRRKLVFEARGPTLEVGCGTGRNLPHYPTDTDLVALDPDLAALRRARRRAPGTLLVAARAEALPFRSDRFETVVSGLVFCSVQNPDRGLAEIRRVLAPDGELRMLEHVRHHRPSLARLQDGIQPAWTWITGGCHPNRDTEATVARAGFAIDPVDRVARGVMRRFSARAEGESGPRI
ncbi:Methyltransferase type 11 [Thioalkalivibrio nitratireducens DSM 14787]|uniref:Methyltransferase type 11 n=1 Tax=Thioalkalivibrio nitratireducens (strain DSM 14787 / UNIQEM 213 / ALEN2) TaxID=1255043 RepID=L0DZV7_THIND|nr:class I SAM-dependent methyltransferase [Thioalkalivibrio nitratireducens]AGA34532.1 Methyltransferase type 11 [Thioalkalivibrio nitratireducens DSM 14787]